MTDLTNAEVITVRELDLGIEVVAESALRMPFSAATRMPFSSLARMPFSSLNRMPFSSLTTNAAAAKVLMSI